MQYRKHLHKAIAAFLLPILLVACKHEEFIEPIEEIVPLQVGNEWRYEVLEYDTEGNVYSKRNYRQVVVKDTVIHLTKWYILNNGRMVRNSREGYVYYHAEAKEAYITYPSKAQGGIGYGYEYPSHTLWVLIKRTNELAPVPDSPHDYSSYVFSFEHQTSQKASSSVSTSFVKDYVLPQVGMVRSDFYYADSDKLFRRYELVSYKLH